MSDMKNPPTKKWHYVADGTDIPLREGRRVRYGDYDVALFNVGEGFLAVDNRCPHRQGPLADGIVAGKSVFCPLHSWKISLESGCAIAGGEGSVSTYPIKVVEGKVYIVFEAARAETATVAGL